MALVGMEDLRSFGIRQFREEFDRPDSTDPEQQLLKQAVLSPATVEPIGHRAQSVLVLRNVRIEQQEADATDRDLPDAGVERAAAGQREGHLGRRAIRMPEHRERKTVRVEHRVRLLLPTVRRDRLGKVARTVEQADADDRDAEVGGALQVVAGEDSEAAGILGKRRRDPELRREVADRFRGALRAVPLVPARLRQIRVQVVEQRSCARHEDGVGSELLQPMRFDLAEETDRVVPALLPALRRDVLEQASRGQMPRPPQVGGELLEGGKRFRQNGANGKSSNSLHRSTLGEQGYRSITVFRRSVRPLAK